MPRRLPEGRRRGCRSDGRAHRRRSSRRCRSARGGNVDGLVRRTDGDGPWHTGGARASTNAIRSTSRCGRSRPCRRSGASSWHASRAGCSRSSRAGRSRRRSTETEKERSGRQGRRARSSVRRRRPWRARRARAATSASPRSRPTRPHRPTASSSEGDGCGARRMRSRPDSTSCTTRSSVTTCTSSSKPAIARRCRRGSDDSSSASPSASTSWSGVSGAGRCGPSAITAATSVRRARSAGPSSTCCATAPSTDACRSMSWIPGRRPRSSPDGSLTSPPRRRTRGHPSLDHVASRHGPGCSRPGGGAPACAAICWRRSSPRPSSRMRSTRRSSHQRALPLATARPIARVTSSGASSCGKWPTGSSVTSASGSVSFHRAR